MVGAFVPFLADTGHTGRRCKTRQHAVKQMSIRQLPPVLCFHVKRFEHTSITGIGRKLNTPLVFPIAGEHPPPPRGVCLSARPWPAHYSPALGCVVATARDIFSSCVPLARAPSLDVPFLVGAPCRAGRAALPVVVGASTALRHASDRRGWRQRLACGSAGLREDRARVVAWLRRWAVQPALGRRLWRLAASECQVGRKRRAVRRHATLSGMSLPPGGAGPVPCGLRQSVSCMCVSVGMCEAPGSARLGVQLCLSACLSDCLTVAVCLWRCVHLLRTVVPLDLPACPPACMSIAACRLVVHPPSAHRGCRWASALLSV
jgi:hypothetical protein